MREFDVRTLRGFDSVASSAGELCNPAQGAGGACGR